MLVIYKSVLFVGILCKVKELRVLYLLVLLNLRVCFYYASILSQCLCYKVGIYRQVLRSVIVERTARLNMVDIFSEVVHIRYRPIFIETMHVYTFAPSEVVFFYNCQGKRKHKMSLTFYISFYIECHPIHNVFSLTLTIAEKDNLASAIYS